MEIHKNSRNSQEFKKFTRIQEISQLKYSRIQADSEQFSFQLN